MIDVKSIRFRNFLSYGDYWTKLDISNLGPVLVVGKNGAGKTTMVGAIIWCLFGRLTNIAKPGDKVINWDIGKNCAVEIETKDGYKIIRTRKHEKYDGKDELLIFDPSGDDVTNSTNTNAQIFLQKHFGLDYNVFVSSMYFGQFSKSFLEMPDGKRREVLEKILHINNIKHYDKTAKDKHDRLEIEQGKLLAVLSTLDRGKLEYERQIQSAEFKEIDYEKDREKDVQRLDAQIAQEESLKESQKIKQVSVISSLKDRLSESPVADLSEIEVLRLKWGKIEKIKNIISTKKSEKSELETDCRIIESNQNNRKSEIKEWENKRDSVCPKCLQDVESDHIGDHVKDLELIITTDSDRLNNHVKMKISKLDALIGSSNLSLKKLTPDKTIKELELEHRAINKARDQIQSEVDRESKELKQIEGRSEDTIKRISNQIHDVTNRQNPYGEMIFIQKEKLEQVVLEIVESKKKVSQYDTLLKHWLYIYQAYHDKKKIRAFILSGLIPLLNKQIEFYFDVMDIELDLEFNAYLQPKMSKWGYELSSGGQKRRIDLAIMLSIYDLHTSIYGTQCNIMVFDEVDGKLDEEGVEGFASLINEDIMNKQDKPDAIIIISHKKDIVESFPDKIEVKMKNGLSYIE
jgi:DNA repair exonuclease SbcCD ATPase subunit